MAVTPLSYSKSICFFSSGGVVLASRDGKIVFESTLDARLEVVFRKKLPEVPFDFGHLILSCDSRTFEFSSCAVVFLKKKTNKFSTLCIIHHWACLISVSILSIGISVLLLLRTAWFFIFHYQLV